MPALVVADRDGRYLDGNEEALALFGVSLEELLALRIGAFSGPHADLAATVWSRIAATGNPLPTGESTVYRPDGSTVRVRYVRIDPRADGAYELEMIEVPVSADGPPNGDRPPAADHPAKVLEAWRAAERDAAAGDPGDAARGAAGLRELYRLSVDEKSRKESRS